MRSGLRHAGRAELGVGMAGDRRQMAARVTAEASRGWEQLLATHRVTFSAIIEATGLELYEGREPVYATVMERAAAIDRQRKSRR